MESRIFLYTSTYLSRSCLGVQNQDQHDVTNFPYINSQSRRFLTGKGDSHASSGVAGGVILAVTTLSTLLGMWLASPGVSSAKAVGISDEEEGLFATVLVIVSNEATR